MTTMMTEIRSTRSLDESRYVTPTRDQKSDQVIAWLMRSA